MAEDGSRVPADRYGEKTVRELSEREEAQKRGIYDAMSARGKKYVDRIGYETWNPFQKPKEPLDIRTDATRRTTLQLVRRFLRERAPDGAGAAYARGVLECALGIVNRDEKTLGVFAFCIWYERLLRREGQGTDDEGTL